MSREIGSWFSIDASSEGGADVIEHALSVIWESVPGDKVSHYKLTKIKSKTDYYCDDYNGKFEGKFAADRTHHYSEDVEGDDGILTLILLWSGENNAVKLPFDLTLPQAAKFIADWLKTIEYPEQPDHDGGNHAGWRIFNDHWGHVAQHHMAVVGVQPQWIMYGK